MTRRHRRAALVLLGRRARKHLGERLATAATATECPVCHALGPLDVHEKAALWPCGHTRDLPPLPQPRRVPTA